MLNEEDMRRMMESMIVAWLERDEHELSFRASWRPKLSPEPRQVHLPRQFTRPIGAHHQRI
jgi:hypothetical protein